MMSVEEMKALAKTCRYDAMKAIHTVGSGHPGGSLSAAEIMIVLFNHVMKIDPKDPHMPDRDRFLLSKGHACPMLFAVLAHRGFFDIKEMLKLRMHDGMLQGTTMPNIPGCETVSGSLGQNLSVGIGTALAARFHDKDYRTYVMVGDGELEEGQNWEAFMLAPKLQLGNLICILDNNHVQMCGTTDEIVGLGDITAKIRAFGWNVINVDGHDIDELIRVFDSIEPARVGTPTCIIADTVKGKGVSFMEGTAKWHGGAPNAEEMAQIEKELGGGTL